MTPIRGSTNAGGSSGTGNSTIDPTPKAIATAAASQTAAARAPTRRTTDVRSPWTPPGGAPKGGILGRCRPVNVTRSRGRAVPYASMSPRTMPTAPASSGLAIRVLGPLEVAVDGTPLVVDTRKALAILALV